MFSFFIFSNLLFSNKQSDPGFDEPSFDTYAVANSGPAYDAVRGQPEYDQAHNGIDNYESVHGETAFNEAGYQDMPGEAVYDEANTAAMSNSYDRVGAGAVYDAAIAQELEA